MLVEGEWAEVTLANLSSTGAMVRCSTPPNVSDKVELRHRGVRIVGEVIWASGNRFGLRSDEDIDLAALTAPSGLQPDRRAADRPAPTTRRARARWIFWNGKD